MNHRNLSPVRLPARLAARVRRFPRLGMSVMEITIVAALSSAILLSAMMIMGRTGRTFQKGSDMMNTQVLLDTITDRLRNDVRGLRSLVPGAGSCDEHTLTFNAFVDGKPHLVKYQFDADKKALYRILDNNEAEKKDFNGPGQILQAVFTASATWEDFRFLNLVLQVNADFGVKEEDRGKKAGSRLAIACQFYPKCREPLSTFAPPKKN